MPENSLVFMKVIFLCVIACCYSEDGSGSDQLFYDDMCASVSLGTELAPEIYESCGLYLATSDIFPTVLSSLIASTITPTPEVDDRTSSINRFSSDARLTTDLPTQEFNSLVSITLPSSSQFLFISSFDIDTTSNSFVLSTTATTFDIDSQLSSGLLVPTQEFIPVTSSPTFITTLQSVSELHTMILDTFDLLPVESTDSMILMETMSTSESLEVFGSTSSSSGLDIQTTLDLSTASAPTATIFELDLETSSFFDLMVTHTSSVDPIVAPEPTQIFQSGFSSKALSEFLDDTRITELTVVLTKAEDLLSETPTPLAENILSSLQTSTPSSTSLFVLPTSNLLENTVSGNIEKTITIMKSETSAFAPSLTLISSSISKEIELSPLLTLSESFAVPSLSIEQPFQIQTDIIFPTSALDSLVLSTSTSSISNVEKISSPTILLTDSLSIDITPTTIGSLIFSAFFEISSTFDIISQNDISDSLMQPVDTQGVLIGLVSPISTLVITTPIDLELISPEIFTSSSMKPTMKFTQTSLFISATVDTVAATSNLLPETESIPIESTSSPLPLLTPSLLISESNVFKEESTSFVTRSILTSPIEVVSSEVFESSTTNFFTEFAETISSLSSSGVANSGLSEVRTFELEKSAMLSKISLEFTQTSLFISATVDTVAATSNLLPETENIPIESTSSPLPLLTPSLLISESNVFKEESTSFVTRSILTSPIEVVSSEVFESSTTNVFTEFAETTSSLSSSGVANSGLSEVRTFELEKSAIVSKTSLASIPMTSVSFLSPSFEQSSIIVTENNELTKSSPTFDFATRSSFGINSESFVTSITITSFLSPSTIHDTIQVTTPSVPTETTPAVFLSAETSFFSSIVSPINTNLVLNPSSSMVSQLILVSSQSSIESSIIKVRSSQSKVFSSSSLEVVSVSMMELSSSSSLSQQLQLSVSTASSERPQPTISADDLRSSLTRLVIRVTREEHQQLRNETSNERRKLETAIVNFYIESLRNLGATRRKRQAINTEAKITEVGDRNGATGNVPVDFYITAGNNPVDSSIVAAVLNRAEPSTIGGYEFISISPVTSDKETASSQDLHIIIAASVGGGVLLLIIICLIISVFIWVKWKKTKTLDDAVETVSVDVEALSFHQKESIAVQHGTPTIEKLMRRTKRESVQKTGGSTLALLASSSSDAWQNNQLGTGQEESPPAALFERVTHYSDLQPMPSPRTFKLKFHSSSVAPSPSTSNQSKTSLVSDSAIKVSEQPHEEKKEVSTSPKVKTRERLKLHSRKAGSRGRRREPEHAEQFVIANNNNKKCEGDSEGDGGLGDVEPSSHSDGAGGTPPPASRPSTRRRYARRKLNSRGYPIAPSATDGYDTTDHSSRVPPSRQSRKHRSGRNMRARPLTQSNLVNGRLARNIEHDARRELAWMSTGNGVQLISIQPMETMMGVPPPQLRPSWQELPQLPPSMPSQTYSRQQLEQLLQIHKELERVEKGFLHQKPMVELSDSKDHYPRLETSTSFSAEELASQAFQQSGQSIPVMIDHPPLLDSRWQLQQHRLPQSQMGQLVWSPQTGSQPLQTQPLSSYQLSQLRSNAGMSMMYPHMTQNHPFGAS